jgi:integrase
MPWRKYQPKQGKYGPVYNIAQGVSVRRDARAKWTLFVESASTRMNRNIGCGREALVKAIKAGEEIASNLSGIEPTNKMDDPTEGANVGFKNFSKQWFEANCKRWEPFTAKRYEEILRLHIWPADTFSKPIDKISRKEIKQHLRSVYKKRSPATVEAVHGVISGVYEEAIDDEIIGANPARGLLKKILPPKNQRDEKQPAPFTRQELLLFIEQSQWSCSWTEQLILKVMAYVGLRLGEALAMRLSHLDVDKMAYHVTESYKLKCFRKPKFGKTRIVDLPAYLVDELKAYVRQLQKENLKQGRGGVVDLLFVDPKETGLWPYSQRKVQGLVKKVCKAAGLGIRNPHDLRHTYATLLLMAHQSPGYVQKQLGHSSISITMDIYCHWIPGEGREGLEEALGGEKFVPNRVRNPHIFAYMKKRPQ